MKIQYLCTFHSIPSQTYQRDNMWGFYSHAINSLYRWYTLVHPSTFTFSPALAPGIGRKNTLRNILKPIAYEWGYDCSLAKVSWLIICTCNGLKCDPVYKCSTKNYDKYIDKYLIWLVVSTHLKNISQNGNLPQIGMKIKTIWNHHPVIHRNTSFFVFRVDQRNMD